MASLERMVPEDLPKDTHDKMFLVESLKVRMDNNLEHLIEERSKSE